MIVINARNVENALLQGVALLRRQGIMENSRNGMVLRAPAPVTTVYAMPCERVLLDPTRDANPFFHLIESLWMLAGRDDLKALTSYVRRMAEFSDDGGVTQPGAYGKRWRDWEPGEMPLHHDTPHYEWGDQLDWVVRRLRADLTDRRVVIQMWDPAFDIDRADHGGRDVPCNLTALPWYSDGRLHLTVFNRSNDVVWGAYGANAVHFSVLLEYLAARIGVLPGTYTQVSNNFHGYLETLPEPPWLPDTDALVAYEFDHIQPMPLFANWGLETLDMNIAQRDAYREKMMKEDLAIFFEHGWRETVTKARWPFLSGVAAPMAAAHEAWRKGKGPDRYATALEIMEQVAASDWQRAGREWLLRRQAASEKSTAFKGAAK